MAKSKQTFDDFAPRNTGALIASGSCLYIVRHAHGHDGDIYYASPLTSPDKVVHLGTSVVTKISKYSFSDAVKVVLKKHNCFYT
jgi:hypothetical protein